MKDFLGYAFLSAPFIAFGAVIAADSSNPYFPLTLIAAVIGGSAVMGVILWALLGKH